LVNSEEWSTWNWHEKERTLAREDNFYIAMLEKGKRHAGNKTLIQVGYFFEEATTAHNTTGIEAERWQTNGGHSNAVSRE
jgi:hypothetical protein